MKASKLYFRDLLGLALVVSAILVMLGGIFGVLAVLNYFSHEEALANTYIHESIPLFIFLIPSYLLGKYINRPKWVSEVEEYQLEAAKKASH
ncbi:D-fructose-6-phosphate amidotransferase [Photobacterium proteolyticum]|uniref:D-fructose-6-phosphate amidotransferase n=1 Tax=Photobacterium proteolyticum TaxID=1903952 RepID=A0A1Q9GHU3_9GAMM|nr:D-fructose-6-phosphate amidotransferase [Photobacterium proteolyticum]OLQ74051.1 D-fructose-6-phosphate amidotransferase [Photobacterium proteolyticum]